MFLCIVTHRIRLLILHRVAKRMEGHSEHRGFSTVACIMAISEQNGFPGSYLSSLCLWLLPCQQWAEWSELALSFELPQGQALVFCHSTQHRGMHKKCLLNNWISLAWGATAIFFKKKSSMYKEKDLGRNGNPDQSHCWNQCMESTLQGGAGRGFPGFTTVVHAEKPGVTTENRLLTFILFFSSLVFNFF